MRSKVAPLVLGIALAASPAGAQEGDRLHEVGEYGGVKAGVTQTTEKGKPIKRAKEGTLAWVGFEAKNGVGTVFLQSAGEMGYELVQSGRVVVVHLTGVKRLGRQVRRPLETRYFDSPVARVTVKKVRARKATKKRPAVKAGYEVRILLKDANASATARAATESDGYFYVYVDVAPGSASTADGPTEAP
jgi:hypothetical protein